MMLKLKSLSHIVVVLLAVVLAMQQSIASEAELCEPFKDKNIDHSMIEAMLNAAKNNNLYRIKQDSSKAGFYVDSSIGVVEGSFDNFKGGLALQGNNSQTMVSINVGSLSTNTSFVEKLLKSDSFFDAEKFPELIFTSTGFKWINSTRAILKGKLSMHGITKGVGFYVDIKELDKDQDGSSKILVKATTTILRSEFGMSSLSSLVDDKVNLSMSAEAERFDKKLLSLNSTSSNNQP